VSSGVVLGGASDHRQRRNQDKCVKSHNAQCCRTSNGPHIGRVAWRHGARIKLAKVIDQKVLQQKWARILGEKRRPGPARGSCRARCFDHRNPRACDGQAGIGRQSHPKATSMRLQSHPKACW
jgi:hypothetical protein